MATATEVRRCTPGHRRRNTGGGDHPNRTKRRTVSGARIRTDVTPPINRDRQNDTRPGHGDLNRTQRNSGTLSPETGTLSTWSPI